MKGPGGKGHAEVMSVFAAIVPVDESGAAHVIRSAWPRVGRGALRVRPHEGARREGTRRGGGVAAALLGDPHAELGARPGRVRAVGQRLGRGPGRAVPLPTPASPERPEREHHDIRARRLARTGQGPRQESLRERGARLALRRLRGGGGGRLAGRAAGSLGALARLLRGGRAARRRHARRVPPRAARPVPRLPAHRVAAPPRRAPRRAAAAAAPAARAQSAPRRPRHRVRARVRRVLPRRVRGPRSFPRVGRASRLPHRPGRGGAALRHGRREAARGVGGRGRGGGRVERRRARVRAAAAPHHARRHGHLLLVRRAAPEAHRAGRRRLQPPVGDARLHSDLPPVEGGAARAVRAAQRLPHLRHAALVEHRQRYPGPPRGAHPDILRAAARRRTHTHTHTL
ncbi:uncharacterized protein FLJ46347 isoform X3 [Maniola hyperantus]|uniref:uncharacterized protein FLJ46347 isoform X3 n=1 Tax=Aphantopus hyperantus TaxID=2795564 RepID=UPI003747CFED